jgi:mannose-6-phosphate isomerase-like protein (cupin superfamily)
MAPESEERPWASWHGIDVNRGYKVERIHAKPSCRLSHQAHDQRSEHWVVTSASPVAWSTVRRSPVGLGHSIDVPQGFRHRPCNESSEELVIIKVQRSVYTGEREIGRFQDDYGRQTHAGA